MACSRAIVATRSGGIPEIVEDGDTGTLVPVRDHTAMAHAIVELLRDSDRRRRMGDAGFARVSARFTVERMVEETAKTYERVLAGRSLAAGTANSPARD
jgi:glycosyltransferase involved in cell wall biosynthesis